MAQSENTTYGKTIEMFLVDGTADGIVTAELSNWNGKAIKLPRTVVPDCKRDDIHGVGIYFLFCVEDDGTDSVYIGEAEDVGKRLTQHLQDYKSGKEAYYWNAAVIFIGRDLDKALIRYLENKLVEEAKACGRDNVLTKSTSATHLKESQIASMGEFMDNVKVLLSALNYRVLTPAPSASENTVILYCKGSKSGAKGSGFVSPNGFTILAGSQVSDHVVDSFREYGGAYYELRERLIKEGVIADDKFTRDCEFSAPSAASAVILGRTSNGNLDWKTKDGTPLKDL